MQLYKVSFVKKKVFSCVKAEHNISFEGNNVYRGHDKQPIFAIVCADSEEVAKQVAQDLLEATENEEE